MDFYEIIATIIGGVLIIGLDVTYIWILSKDWLKERKLVSYFPSWENTRKPFIWWLIWSCAIFTNLIVFMLSCLIANTMEAIYISLTLIVPLYSGGIGFIYICVKNAIKEQY